MTMHSSSSAHASYSLLLTNEKNSPLHTVSTISDTNLCLCSWCILSLLYISRMLISTLSHRAATTERSPREDTARCPVTTPGKAEAMPVSTRAHAFFFYSICKMNNRSMNSSAHISTPLYFSLLQEFQTRGCLQACWSNVSCSLN